MFREEVRSLVIKHENVCVLRENFQATTVQLEGSREKLIEHILELQSRLESLEQENLKVYHIGAKTEELVFRRNGIQNVADMQAVFDAVEGALESLEKDAAREKALEEELRLVLEWATTEKKALRQQEIASIRRALAFDAAMKG